MRVSRPARAAAAAAAVLAAASCILAGVAGGATVTYRSRFDTRVLAHVPNPGYPGLSLVSRDRRFIYVGTFTNAAGTDTGPSKVFKYSPSGKLLHTYVVKGQTPGASHGVQVAAEDRAGGLYLLDQNPARIVRLNPRTGEQRTYARFHDVQPCVPGTAPQDCGDTVMDNPPEPDYAAWGTDGVLYVTDYTQGLIWRVPTGGGNAHVWFTDPRLDGSLFGPAGIVMMPDHRTLMLSTSAGGATSPDATTGELYKLQILPNRRPGPLVKIWESGPKEAPDGFALARSGNVYLALVGPDVNQLVVISPTGTELARFPGDTSGDNDSKVPFDEPSSVQFIGRRLIVTNDAYISGDHSHHVIFDVWAGERGAPVFISGLPKYHLRVRPRSVTQGTRHTFRFHAKRNDRSAKHALVRFAGLRVRTDRHGNAKIRTRLGSGRPVRVARLSVGPRLKVVARAKVAVLAPGAGR
jgi:sugar lactone lactonase YvrE